MYDMWEILWRERERQSSDKKWGHQNTIKYAAFTDAILLLLFYTIFIYTYVSQYYIESYFLHYILKNNTTMFLCVFLFVATSKSTTSYKHMKITSPVDSTTIFRFIYQIVCIHPNVSGFNSTDSAKKILHLYYNKNSNFLLIFDWIWILAFFRAVTLLLMYFKVSFSTRVDDAPDKVEWMHTTM